MLSAGRQLPRGGRGEKLMLDTRISRRAALMGAGTVMAWIASPARALLQAAGQRATPAFIDSVIARMTVEEKAGQLSLMASAWGPSAAAALNPPNDSNFPRQLDETRQGQLTGIFNGNGARMARIMQTAAMTESRMKIPLIFAADIIHGHRTVFPVPVAEARSEERRVGNGRRYGWWWWPKREAERS